MNSIEGVGCRVLSAEFVSELYLLFNVSVEGGVVVADGTSRDELPTGSDDYCIEVFDCEVDVVVVGYVELVYLFLYCCGEFVPVCFLVVSVCGFGSASVGGG